MLNLRHCTLQPKLQAKRNKEKKRKEKKRKEKKRKERKEKKEKKRLLRGTQAFAVAKTATDLMQADCTCLFQSGAVSSVHCRQFETS